MDHMEIGSTLLQILISRLIKGAVSKKLGKKIKMSIIFNSPLIFKNDGENVELKFDGKVKMPSYDFKELMETIISGGKDDD